MIYADKICEQYGSKMGHVSWELARYEWTMSPAQYKLTEYRKEVVKCPRCRMEKEEDDDLSTAKSVFLRGKAPASVGCGRCDNRRPFLVWQSERMAEIRDYLSRP